MFSKLSLPVKIGLGFGLAGILLVIIGIVRGTVPMNPASIAMALLIGGGFWFLVSWAVATAAVDVESDVEESDHFVSDHTVSDQTGSDLADVDGQATID
jgi:hypothetical protein